jgi:hypothetical protein
MRHRRDLVRLVAISEQTSSELKIKFSEISEYIAISEN